MKLLYAILTNGNGDVYINPAEISTLFSPDKDKNKSTLIEMTNGTSFEVNGSVYEYVAKLSTEP